MFNLLQSKRVAALINDGAALERLSVAKGASTTPREWLKRGVYYNDNKTWASAVLCFQKAGQPQLAARARAHELYEGAKALAPGEAQREAYLVAAAAYIEAQSPADATKIAICLRRGGKALPAARTYWALGKWDWAEDQFVVAGCAARAAELFRSVGQPRRAETVLERSGDNVQLAAQMEREGRLVEAFKKLCGNRISVEPLEAFAKRQVAGSPALQALMVAHFSQRISDAAMGAAILERAGCRPAAIAVLLNAASAKPSVDSELYEGALRLMKAEEGAPSDLASALRALGDAAGGAAALAASGSDGVVRAWVTRMLTSKDKSKEKEKGGLKEKESVARLVRPLAYFQSGSACEQLLRSAPGSYATRMDALAKLLADRNEPVRAAMALLSKLAPSPDVSKPAPLSAEKAYFILTEAARMLAPDGKVGNVVAQMLGLRAQLRAKLEDGEVVKEKLAALRAAAAAESADVKWSPQRYGHSAAAAVAANKLAAQEVQLRHAHQAEFSKIAEMASGLETAATRARHLAGMMAAAEGLLETGSGDLRASHELRASARGPSSRQRTTIPGTDSLQKAFKIYSLTGPARANLGLLLCQGSFLASVPEAALSNPGGGEANDFALSCRVALSLEGRCGATPGPIVKGSASAWLWAELSRTLYRGVDVLTAYETWAQFAPMPGRRPTVAQVQARESVRFTQAVLHISDHAPGPGGQPQVAFDVLAVRLNALLRDCNRLADAHPVTANDRFTSVIGALAVRMAAVICVTQSVSAAFGNAKRAVDRLTDTVRRSNEAMLSCSCNGLGTQENEYCPVCMQPWLNNEMSLFGAVDVALQTLSPVRALLHALRFEKQLPGRRALEGFEASLLALTQHIIGTVALLHAVSDPARKLVVSKLVGGRQPVFRHIGTAIRKALTANSQGRYGTILKAAVAALMSPSNPTVALDVLALSRLLTSGSPAPLIWDVERAVAQRAGWSWAGGKGSAAPPFAEAILRLRPAEHSYALVSEHLALNVLVALAVEGRPLPAPLLALEVLEGAACTALAALLTAYVLPPSYKEWYLGRMPLQRAPPQDALKSQAWAMLYHVRELLTRAELFAPPPGQRAPGVPGIGALHPFSPPRVARRRALLSLILSVNLRRLAAVMRPPSWPPRDPSKPEESQYSELISGFDEGLSLSLQACTPAGGSYSRTDRLSGIAKAFAANEASNWGQGFEEAEEEEAEDGEGDATEAKMEEGASDAKEAEGASDAKEEGGPGAPVPEPGSVEAAKAEIEARKAKREAERKAAEAEQEAREAAERKAKAAAERAAERARRVEATRAGRLTEWLKDFAGAERLAPMTAAGSQPPQAVYGEEEEEFSDDRERAATRIQRAFRAWLDRSRQLQQAAEQAAEQATEAPSEPVAEEGDPIAATVAWLTACCQELVTQEGAAPPEVTSFANSTAALRRLDVALVDVAQTCSALLASQGSAHADRLEATLRDASMLGPQIVSRYHLSVEAANGLLNRGTQVGEAWAGEDVEGEEGSSPLDMLRQNAKANAGLVFNAGNVLHHAEYLFTELSVGLEGWYETGSVTGQLGVSRPSQWPGLLQLAASGAAPSGVATDGAVPPEGEAVDFGYEPAAPNEEDDEDDTRLRAKGARRTGGARGKGRRTQRRRKATAAPAPPQQPGQSIGQSVKIPLPRPAGRG